VVRLAQEVREEWSRTVEEHVTEQTEIAAQETLETYIDLTAELGDIALEEMRALLQDGYDEWQPDGNTYTRALENGISLRYTPDSGHLQVVARLSETVEAAASGSSAASGLVEGQVAVEGQGRYYDDEWGGYTEQRARRAAEQDAQRQISRAREQLLAEQQQDSLDTARQQARARAQAEARARLEEETERRQAMLQEHLETLLRESEEMVQAAIGPLLGQTYRRALLRLAHENGGQVVQDSESEGSIDLVLRI
jgi:hypothetical protein